MALSDNLIEYWTMESTSGSLGTANLTAVGSPSTVTGKINNGRQYVGGTSRDDFTYSSAVSAGTIAFWFKYTSIANSLGRLVNKTHAGVSDVLITYIDTSNRFNVVINDSANLNTSFSTLSTSTWYHYAVTWDGSNVKTYKNGTLETNAVSTKTLQSDSTVFSIGGTGANSQGINGIVDEVGFWSRALSSTEISQLYNSGTGYTYPLPFFYSLLLDYGSFSLTGQALIFSRGYYLALAQASFTLTGQTLSFILNLYTRVTNRVKHATVLVNKDKTASATVVNRTKHSSTVTNRQKS